MGDLRDEGAPRLPYPNFGLYVRTMTVGKDLKPKQGGPTHTTRDR